MCVGHFGAFVIRELYPAFPAWPPTWAVLARFVTALVTGIVFGVLPARRAASARSSHGIGSALGSRMRLQDAVDMSWRSITAQRSRSILTLLGIAVGIAAVILLTSIGEGLHRFVLAEFTQFGTNVIRITPARRRPAAQIPVFRRRCGRSRSPTRRL